MPDQPAEHCGHPPATLATHPTECVLRPGHSGSHADKTGMRWWRTAPATIAARADADADVRDIELEQLRAELAALKAISGGYCPACGRGDCSPSADQWYEQKQRADRAETERDTARATVQRLNRRAQQAEAENAAYRRAVAHWDVSERGTYIPHASLAAIGRAAGTEVLGSVRHLRHFERVEQAEAVIERVRALAECWRYTDDRKGGPLRELRAALDRQEQPDA